MIPKRLQSRLKTIKATPLKDRAQAKTFSRREISSVSPEVDIGNEKYDTFFEYEDELAELKPSSEQYNDMVSSPPFVVLEEVDEPIPESAEVSTSPIEMEEANSAIVMNNNDNKVKNFSSFNFIQCEFIKADKNRCKRQAPKDSTLCSSHRKYLKDRGGS